MHALVTSPVPSHPQNHGNRARVFALCKELQARGYKVHFLYGGLEGLTATQERDLRAEWDHVYILPKDAITRKRSHRSHYLIDDWYPAAVTDMVKRILSIWDVRICLANYVWFSGWLDVVPRHIPRFIDTHDIFGNRHKALKRDGLLPNWFYTTPKEEAKALARASTVLAIQEEEAKIFARLTKTDVDTLGFFDTPHYLPALSAKNRQKLRVGYIASNNPINQNAMAGLNESLAKYPQLADRCDFFLAGPICTTGPGEDSQFTRLGFVPSVEDFYSDMDVILNPNIGGTGLKIKSVEALRYGRPLLATRDAMIGIASPHTQHACPDIDTICQELQSLTESETALRELEKAGREVYDAYVRKQRETLDHLFPNLVASAAEGTE